MRQRLTKDDVIAAIQKVADETVAAADRLRELDAAIGDGDLGITMQIGFQAVRDALPSLAGTDITTILGRAGMAFNRKAASTFGALFATMLMRAGGAVKGRETLGLRDLAEMAAAAAQGVRERGKAEVGDKTLLDALVPAADALAQAADRSLSLAEGLELAVAAAERGVQTTAAMKSKQGRASWFSERTQGIPDPGATAIAIMLRALADFVKGEPITY